MGSEPDKTEKPLAGQLRIIFEIDLDELEGRPVLEFIKGAHETIERMSDEIKFLKERIRSLELELAMQKPPAAGEPQ